MEMKNMVTIREIAFEEDLCSVKFSEDSKKILVVNK